MAVRRGCRTPNHSLRAQTTSHGQEIDDSEITENSEVLFSHGAPLFQVRSPAGIYARFQPVPYLFPRRGPRRKYSRHQKIQLVNPKSHMQNEILNPKSETLNKHECSKLEIQSELIRNFVLRASNLFRISCLGFRVFKMI